MLRDRAIQLQFVKKPAGTSAPNSPAEDTRVTPDDIAQIVMYHAGHAARLVGTLYVTHKLVSTAATIAVIAAEAHFNKK